MPKQPSHREAESEASAEQAPAVDAAHVEFFSVESIQAVDDPTTPVRPKKTVTTERQKRQKEGVKRRIEKQREALAKTVSDSAANLPTTARTEKQQMAHFRRLLIEQSGEQIITTIISKALDPHDTDQMAALKFCGERIMPLEQFQDKGGGSTPRIHIHIDTADGTGGILQEQHHRRKQEAIDVDATEIPNDPGSTDGSSEV